MKIDEEYFALYVPKVDRGCVFNIVKKEDNEKYYFCIEKFDVEKGLFICKWNLFKNVDADKYNNRKVKFYDASLDCDAKEKDDLIASAIFSIKFIKLGSDISAELCDSTRKIIKINCMFDNREIKNTYIDGYDLAKILDKYNDEIRIKICEGIVKEDFNKKYHEQFFKDFVSRLQNEQ